MLSHINEHVCMKAIYIQRPCALKNEDLLCIEFYRRERIENSHAYNTHTHTHTHKREDIVWSLEMKERM